MVKSSLQPKCFHEFIRIDLQRAKKQSQIFFEVEVLVTHFLNTNCCSPCKKLVELVSELQEIQV